MRGPGRSGTKVPRASNVPRLDRTSGPARTPWAQSNSMVASLSVTMRWTCRPPHDPAGTFFTAAIESDNGSAAIRRHTSTAGLPLDPKSHLYVRRFLDATTRDLTHFDGACQTHPGA